MNAFPLDLLEQTSIPVAEVCFLIRFRDNMLSSQTTDRNLAYTFLRVFLGVNLAVHGASRIYSGVPSFATELVSQFAETPLPSRMVYLFAVSLPFAEALIGVLIFVGFGVGLPTLGGSIDNQSHVRVHAATGLDGCGMATPVCIRLCSIAGVSRAQPLLGGWREKTIAARAGDR
jgi:hypothetical protein